jgi:hypothetical protein
MTSKHTPGPWRVEPDAESSECFVFTESPESPRMSNAIALVFHDHARGRPRMVVDAALIAAAPKLLEACRLALGVMEQTNKMDVPHYVKTVTVTFDPDDVAKLRAAIKEAEGEP